VNYLFAAAFAAMALADRFCAQGCGLAAVKLGRDLADRPQGSRFFSAKTLEASSKYVRPGYLHSS